MDSGVAALELADITSGYGNTTVLRDISLRVPTGSVVALLGANGAGKTTVLRAAAGLNPVSRGRVSVFGADVTPEDPARRARRGVCLIPEGRAVFKSLSVRENLVLQVRGSGAAHAVEKAAEAFPILGRRLGQTAGSLSGGEQQMLALARAYTTDPRVVLVDEPSLGLAPQVVETVFGFLDRLAAGGTALLVVDQFIGRVLDSADYAYVLAQGELTFAGTPAQLRSGDVFEKYLG
ncbi:ABC transporter ATP-binding protein [Nocardia jinanensis]|uniref:ABC transporter ATP-binding protein n=1 Tax=Nocardia jinanensis TaxID=382504 RepID=A0A917RNA3_9NOCA|nr:ABC transporter ATP-binding protein [Nocardia jinanensis]GGL14835.1 ABC transporter ATP-binding protein [Nocardia jinanensis]